MSSRGAIAALVFAAGACASTSGLSSAGNTSGPRTRAERTGFTETSHYADVISFIDSLRGRPELSFGSIGRTNEGREIPYVIASRPRVATPEEAKALGRPILYIQGNIHAGEVEGKEALLALLRDLTSSRRSSVLDSVVLIAVPIYNADGNERLGPQDVNRGSQNGPQLVGVRANAQGLDLNRDYMKAEAPETRASLAMFNTWDPDVFVDLHTTNGSYHGYALTYAPPLSPSAPLGTFTRDSIMPVLRRRMQERHGFPTFDYGDFISDDTLSKGWITFDARPRFGTNYYGLRGKIAILSEAYSHDPFERRVKSTYAFAREILSLAAERASRIRSLTSRFPATLVLTAAPDGSVRGVGTLAPVEVVVRSDVVAAPDSVPVVAEIMERTGDSTRTQTGVRRGLRRTGRFVPVRMPVFDRFKPTLTVRIPRAYLIPPGDTLVVRVLKAHGISVAEMAATNPQTVERFVIDSTIQSPRAFQGHREMRLDGRWVRSATGMPGGWFMVDTSQRLGILATYLLEPQSDDGLATWNYFDRDVAAGKTFPILRLPGNSPAGD